MSCNRDYPDRRSLGPRAIAAARERVGDAAVDAAERLVLERRAAAAAAASTPAAPPTINHLMLTQQLAAAVRAAQLRAETTERAAARAEAEATAAYLAAVAEPLATRQAAWDEVAEAKEAQARHCKHQRTAAPEAPAPAEPAWRRRPYAAYSTVEYWRQYEGEIWNRRRVPLSGKPKRPAAKLPRPSSHDERGGCPRAVRCVDVARNRLKNVKFRQKSLRGGAAPAPPAGAARRGTGSQKGCIDMVTPP